MVYLVNVENGLGAEYPDHFESLLAETHIAGGKGDCVDCRTEPVTEPEPLNEAEVEEFLEDEDYGE